MTPIENPQKALSIALLDLQGGSNNWEKQNQACNVLRQLLRFNPETFTASVIKNMTGQLTKLADSLRSILSKSAIQTLQESF